MSRVLVDANVLLDVLTDDPQWHDWSAAQLDACAARGELCINPIVYAEVSVGFERIEQLDDALSSDSFTHLELPWGAGFLAGKAFLQYRRARGVRRSATGLLHRRPRRHRRHGAAEARREAVSHVLSDAGIDLSVSPRVERSPTSDRRGLQIRWIQVCSRRVIPTR
ncbi:MAG: type II toxin-antitoxin system VapC family toxin [Rhodanobacter sp.]